MFIAYWRGRDRKRHYGFIKARTHDEAYDFAVKKLPKDCQIVAIYRANPAQVNENSICLNF